MELPTATTIKEISAINVFDNEGQFVATNQDRAESAENLKCLDKLYENNATCRLKSLTNDFKLINQPCSTYLEPAPQTSDSMTSDRVIFIKTEGALNCTNCSIKEGDENCDNIEISRPNYNVINDEYYEKIEEIYDTIVENRVRIIYKTLLSYYYHYFYFLFIYFLL